MLRNTHLVAVSSNTKTGPIATSYRPQTTCPSTCPFLGKGCYGDGRLFALARKYARDLARSEALAILRKAKVRLLRDRVVGDVVDGDGRIDWNYLTEISTLARMAGLRVFGYTHAWRRFTEPDARRLADMGYVMNASCETIGDVRQAISLGMPAVITNDDIAEGLVIDGRRVITCPAQTRDDVTCATCQLCAKPDVPVVIRFLVHGPSKNKARQAVKAANG